MDPTANEDCLYNRPLTEIVFINFYFFLLASTMCVQKELIFFKLNCSCLVYNRKKILALLSPILISKNLI